MTRDEAMIIAREVFASDVTERQMNDLVDFVSALGLIKYRTKEDDEALILGAHLDDWSGLKDSKLSGTAVVAYIKSLGYKIVRK